MKNRRFHFPLLLIVLVANVCVLQAKYTHELAVAAQYDTGSIKTLDVSEDGTIFFANSDNLFAYSYKDSILMLIDSIKTPSIISDVTIGADSIIFSVSSDGLDAYYFNGESFSHRAHIDSAGENIEVDNNNTIYLIKHPYWLRVFSFNGDEILYKTSVGPFFRPPMDVALATDSTVFIAFYYGGVSIYKYDGSSLIKKDNINEEEWDEFAWVPGSPLNGVSVLGDTALFVIARNNKIYPYIYKDGVVKSKSVVYVNETEYSRKTISAYGSNVFVYNDYFGYVEMLDFTGDSLMNNRFIGEFAFTKDVVMDQDGIIYCAHNRDGLFVYENNGSKYIKTAQTEMLGYPVDVESYNDSILFVASQISGIQAYKYANKSFERVACFNNVIATVDIEIDSNIIFLADGLGLKAYEFTDNSLNLMSEIHNYNAHYIDVADNGTIFAVSKSGDLCAYEYTDHTLKNTAYHNSENCKFSSILSLSNDTVITASETGITNIYSRNDSAFNLVLTDADFGANAFHLSDNGMLFISRGYTGLYAYVFKQSMLVEKARYHEPSILDIEVNDFGIILANTNTSLSAYKFNGDSFEKCAETLWKHARKIDISKNNTIFLVDDVTGIFTIELTPLTHITPLLENNFELHQNYPNPFNPKTAISYQLSAVSDIDLAIYDIAGRLIRKWSYQSQQAGSYEINWNGTDRSGNPVPSGVYIYCMMTEEFVQSKKMVLLK